MELTVREYIPSGAEAGRQKMQCKCALMMCEEEVGLDVYKRQVNDKLEVEKEIGNEKI